MAGNLIGDLPRTVGEVGVELALLLQLHEVLADIEGMRRHQLGILGREKMRIFALEHQAAARHRRDDVIPSVHPGLERRHVGLRLPQDPRNVPRIEERHPAALLLGPDHLDAVLLEDRDRRLSHFHRMVIDQAGGE